MIHLINRLLRLRSVATPVVAGQSNLRISLAGKFQSVSQSVSQSVKTPYNNRPILLLLILLLPIFSIGEATANGKNGTEEATKGQLQEAYGKLPLYFIQNNGQVDEKVKFYEKGSGHSTFFTKDGVFLSLSPPIIAVSRNPEQSEGEAKQSQDHDSESQLPSSYIPSPLAGDGKGGGNPVELVKLSFLNANPNPEIIAVDPQEGKVNYFIGNDPRKWRTNIPTYQAVLYKEVYPGIDIKFYGNNKQLEYDIIVRPGADPSKVRFVYEGIEGLKIAENGDLEIVLDSPSSLAGEGKGEGNKIIQKKPVIYQEIDGKRVSVEGRFKVQDNTVVASGAKQSSSSSENVQFAYTFEVASFDKKHLLIIDPTLSYSTFLGGGSYDWGNSIVVDYFGNAYLTGYTNNLDFPTTPGAYDTTFNGGSPYFSTYDAFVVKLNASGSSLTYATYLGGSGGEEGSSIAVDGSGNAYITGYTSSSDFPTTIVAYSTTLSGLTDAFVVKLDASGSSLAYSTYLGGSAASGSNGDEQAKGIAVDGSGNAYVTGTTTSSNFPVTPGAFDTTFSGWAVDAFVVRLDATGSFLTYATYLGGSEYDNSSGIAVDGSENVYVTGETYSSDFPTTAGSFDTTYNGGYWDIFVAKLDMTGSSLYYATYIGGIGSDFGNKIAVDSIGNAYITGETNSSDFPTTIGAYSTTLSGGGDAFVAKLNASGSSLSYATYLGGDSSEQGNDIAVDSSGNAHVTGGTNSLDFPTTIGAYSTTLSGAGDVFVAKLNTSGSSLIYGTYIGGSNYDGGYGITVDSVGNAYVTGRVDSWVFPTTPGAYDTMRNGFIDAFVIKFSFPPAELPRTGQTTCYDSAGAVIPCAGTGQDGEIQAGVPWPDTRFTDNGDGTVTDNLSGLMWTQNGNAPGPAVCSPGTTKIWQNALDYVACLNINAYLGYTDWRLPNINEIESLTNAGLSNTQTWLNTHGFNNVRWEDYWSSTTYAYTLGTSYAWGIFMSDGGVSTYSKSGSYYVWPVRSGQNTPPANIWETGQTKCFNSAGTEIACAGTGQDGEIKAGAEWPSPRFTDNVNGTVTDNLTALIWTKDANAPGPAACSPAITNTWQGALIYVDCLNTNAYLGYTDWRLPNRKELQSLTDFSQYNPALPSGHPFLNVQSNFYLSSTTYVYYTGSAGIVHMGSGRVYAYDKSNSYYNVWPVRGGLVPPAEICDGIDNDGDGLIDEGLTNTYYADSDGDTYGNASVTTEACTQPSGYAADSTDCNDGNASINPGALELCNGIDDNCNGEVDEGITYFPYYRDADSDGYGDLANSTLACNQPLGYVSNSTDCNDSNALINPGAAEVCNGVDDNCNGQTDEGVQNTYYEDADGDTYGSATVTTQACTAPTGYVSDDTDCDDSNASIYPAATEIPDDGIDQDCNGTDLITPELSNISTRGQVLTGDGVMIGGFWISGTDPMSVLIRARGPSLVDFGVTGAMADPTVQCFSGQTPIAQNNDWQTTDPLCGSPAVSCGDATDIQNTGFDPCSVTSTGCTLDSAIYVTLPPGGYTCILSGVNNGTGVGIVEVFDVDSVSSSKLVNISTRGPVLTGDSVMIGGFWVSGTDPKSVLLRARGPSLAAFGVNGAMANPVLELYSGQTLVASNDDWQTANTQCDSPLVSCGTVQDIIDTGFDPCSVTSTGCTLDAAMHVTLPPGGYTAILKGVNDGTGVGIVEVFEVSP